LVERSEVVERFRDSTVIGADGRRPETALSGHYYQDAARGFSQLLAGA
jgi:hypothetical protein